MHSCLHAVGHASRAATCRATFHALLLALLPLLSGCELAFDSNSGGGTHVSVSDTTTVQFASSAETSGSRVRFSTTGL
ncbi:MAG: hypothetical protein K8T26_07005 [Lentisphaerae bacterium]|nr:hypothetical protein [Lentisphaerota bacterium]